MKHESIRWKKAKSYLRKSSILFQSKTYAFSTCLIFQHPPPPQGWGTTVNHGIRMIRKQLRGTNNAGPNDAGQANEFLIKLYEDIYFVLRPSCPRPALSNATYSGVEMVKARARNGNIPSTKTSNGTGRKQCWFVFDSPRFGSVLGYHTTRSTW